MEPYTAEQLVAMLSNAENVIFNGRTKKQNTTTRDGIYLTIQKGLSSRSVFIGEDLINKCTVIEDVG